MWIRTRHRTLIDAIRAGDERRVEELIVTLSGSRRIFAPLEFAVGAFVVLFDGLKVLVSNWRLGLIEAMPAMWAWAAMLDLRVHVLRGRGVRAVHGPTLYLLVALIAFGTVAATFLNTVFAFALAAPGPPKIRPAVALAVDHKLAIGSWGAAIGTALGLATLVSGRWGKGWFALSLGIVVACLMFSFVAIPSRILGGADARKRLSKRDRVAAAIIGGLLGAVVCTPPYLIGRLGIVLLGSRVLFVPAIILLIVGFGLQAGAAGSVRAIKMSHRLRATGTGEHTGTKTPGERLSGGTA